MPNIITQKFRLNIAVYKLIELNFFYRNNQSPGQPVRSERREEGTVGAAGTRRRARHHYRKSVRAS